MLLPCLEGHTSAQEHFFPLVVFPVFFGPGLNQRVGRAVCEGPGARKRGCWSRGGCSKHHWHILSCSSGKLVSAHVARATRAWQERSYEAGWGYPSRTRPTLGCQQGCCICRWPGAQPSSCPQAPWCGWCWYSSTQGWSHRLTTLLCSSETA